MRIRQFVATTAVLLVAATAQSQTWSGPGSGELGRGGPLRSTYVAADPETERLLSFLDLNACPDNGSILKQNSSGEWSCAVDETGGSGSGSTISSGTADPTGGADGDAYIQVDGSDEIQAIWSNASGTWEEYTLPAGPAGAAGPAGPAGPAGTDGAGTALSDATPNTVVGSGGAAGSQVPTLRAEITNITWPMVLSRNRRFRTGAFTPQRSRITRSRPPRFQTKESVTSSSDHP